jgi:hypothetical protein
LDKLILERVATYRHSEALLYQLSLFLTWVVP